MSAGTHRRARGGSHDRNNPKEVTAHGD